VKFFSGERSKRYDALKLWAMISKYSKKINNLSVNVVVRLDRIRIPIQENGTGAGERLAIVVSLRQ
jgi:hypothetical protein